MDGTNDRIESDSQTIRPHIACFHMWVLDYIHMKYVYIKSHTDTYKTKVEAPIGEKESDWYHE